MERSWQVEAAGPRELNDSDINKQCCMLFTESSDLSSSYPHTESLCSSDQYRDQLQLTRSGDSGRNSEYNSIAI